MSWQVIAVLGGIALLVPFVVKKPVIAIPVLLGAAVTLENYPLGWPDSFTDTFGFFLNLNNTAGLPVSITPAEIVMVVAILCWWAARSSGKLPAVPATPVRRAYIGFFCVVALAELNGIMSGGNWNISLWELRPQVYGFVLFLLTSTLVRTRRDVVTIAVVFLACATFKAALGFNRYFFVLHQDLNGREAILGHEDSYFLLLFAVAFVVSLIWARRRKVVLPMLLLTPLATITMLENQRRVAMVALWGAIVVVVVMAIFLEPRLRKGLIIVTTVVVVAFIGFVQAEWNQENGLAGQIVRPVHAMVGQVDQRDYLSDLYRINENADLITTYATSPVIGYGFGKPMLVPFPLADIAQQDPFWQYITHNSILWIGMRMGMIGMAAFWALIGMIVMQGIRMARAQTDPFLRGVAVFALAAVAAQLVVGYGDLQMEAQRNMVFFGVMVGLMEALARVRVAVEEPAPAPGLTRWQPSPALVTVVRRPAEG